MNERQNHYRGTSTRRAKNIFLTSIMIIIPVAMISVGIMLISFSKKDPEKVANNGSMTSENIIYNYQSSGTEDISSLLDSLNSELDASDISSENNQNPPAGTVRYKGPIEHIFVHPLVAYPELAFDGDYEAAGMDDFMTTAEEFQRVLEECYKNDYILINVEEVFGEYKSEEDGTTKFGRIPMYLPEGKKPMIISTDDMNYYEYMRDNGCNYKMVIGPDGNIAMYSKNPQGEDVVSYTTEVVPLVDKFVREHPDFSHNGAKGIVGLTGYDGILGYRTNSENTVNRQDEIESVKPIVARLKETGWTFASHSYGHPHFNNISYEKVMSDTNKYKEEVTPLIGDTFVYLFPYGEWPEHGSDKYEYLYDAGFRYFSGVGIKQYSKDHGGRYTFDDRKNIDGYTLRNRPDKIEHMMDADVVRGDKSIRGSERGKGIGVK